MFRNYLVTALRNLERNRLYAAISILGLAVAFTAAILIGQFVRNEFSYDTWFPGHRNVYKIIVDYQLAGQSSSAELTPTDVAGRLKAQLPDAVVARLMEAFPGVRHGEANPSVVDRSFAWADPDLFKVFPLPVLAGNLSSALQQPDTVVVTRRVARKYFGYDLPMGGTLEVQLDDHTRHTMRVTAVLKDLPANTNLTTEIFASGRSSYSDLSRLDARPLLGATSTFTFVRLRPGASAARLQQALDVAGQLDAAIYIRSDKFALRPLRLDKAHMTPQAMMAASAKQAGSRPVALSIAALGALIILVASTNFVTLMTARAARRAVEVGVRKTSGARRIDLVAQFTGETLIQVFFAAVIAMALSELLLPTVSAFVQRSLTLDFVRDPALLASVLGSALCVGVLAAIYPALVLSRFRAAGVLKGGPIQGEGSSLARQSLVVIQFAVLVALIATTATMYRQTEYALARGIGTQDGQRIVRAMGACDGAFPAEVRRLPGVSAAACSNVDALNTPAPHGIMPVRLPGGHEMTFDSAPVDFGFLELYDVKPLAGRLFSSDYGQDSALARAGPAKRSSVIINETAARRLGFADPATAVDHQMLWRFGLGAPLAPSQIIGVVPDAPATVRRPADPTFYFIPPKARWLTVLSIKLTGQDIPGTVRAIETAWERTGHLPPVQETFLAQDRADLYLDLIIQSATIAICAGLAILIACLGLFALSAYTTERRTKEIGVRKAMGADTRDVVLLLLWQFTLPVLTASAIAIPIGLWAMSWWLHGFVYHVSLSAWPFVMAPAAAVAIAWLTVSWQSFTVARAKPAGALRYE